MAFPASGIEKEEVGNETAEKLCRNTFFFFFLWEGGEGPQIGEEMLKSFCFLHFLVYNCDESLLAVALIEVYILCPLQYIFK